MKKELVLNSNTSLREASWAVFDVRSRSTELVLWVMSVNVNGAVVVFSAAVRAARSLARRLQEFFPRTWAELFVSWLSRLSGRGWRQNTKSRNTLKKLTCYQCYLAIYPVILWCCCSGRQGVGDNFICRKWHGRRYKATLLFHILTQLCSLELLHDASDAVTGEDVRREDEHQECE